MIDKKDKTKEIKIDLSNPISNLSNNQAMQAARDAAKARIENEKQKAIEAARMKGLATNLVESEIAKTTQVDIDQSVNIDEFLSSLDKKKK